MGFSRYPNGFNHGLVVRNVPITPIASGKVFYVGNNATLLASEKSASNTNDGSFLAPFSTLDYAIGRCAANRGDIIYVRPNHTETISAADTIDFDVEGISVVGLGNGDNRPRFDYTAGAGEVAVGADNVLIENINFHANVDSVLIAVDVEDGVDFTTIRNCLFDVETTGTDEFDNAIRFTNNNTGFLVEDCYVDMGIGDAVRAIYLDADTDNGVIRNNFIQGDFSTACIGGDTTASTNILIDNNILINGSANDLGTVECIELLTGTTGYIRNNLLVCNVATPDLAIVADTCILSGNRYSESIAGADAALYSPTLTDDANNILGVDDSNNAFSSSNVAANVDGSIIERLEALMDPNGAYVPGLGFRVTKTSNLADGAGTDDLFTVTGSVMVNLVVGEVTTVVATTTTMKLRDTTNSVDLCAATTITSDADGTMYLFSGVASETLNSGVTPVIGVAYKTTGGTTPVILGNAGGSSTISHVLDGAGTGNVLWTMYYLPISSGASVAAAA